MAELHPMNRALLTLLENQVQRTAAALDGLPETLLTQRPGGDCKTILEIARHLWDLRRFQLRILEHPAAERLGDSKAAANMADLRAGLNAGADAVRAALEQHDPQDWYATPAQPRQGLWGELPTLLRFCRPFNDFVNHLGSIRAIRRILGSPADKTQ
jgi:hypothetical protein